MVSGEREPIDVEEHRAMLVDERARTVERIAGLRRDFETFVEAADLVNTDDEHDPEGHTIAYERAQVISLREEAETVLAGIDAALGAIDDGTYGRCRNCGGPIGGPRLEALPGVQTCITCAATGTA